MEMQFTGPGLASGADIEMLTALWSSSFGDPEPLIRNFLTVVASNENTVVYREDGRVVSCAFLIPATLHIGRDTYRAYYFYAAATLPDERRQGYMEQVIRFSRSLCEERGIDFLVLVPTNNDLYQYFSRFGFRANFYLKTTEMDRGQLTALAEKMVSGDGEEAAVPVAFAPTEMQAIREQALAAGSWLEFDRSTLQYLFFDHVFRGGKTLLLPDGYALYELSEDDSGERVLKVRELCSVGDPGKLLKELVAVEADRYVLNLPAFDSIRGGRTATGRAGMDLAISKEAVRAERSMKNAYIGLTLG
ncbi:MAG: GNAT family N-acetyltransferase [Clostridia bacterium]|nr:GNAT family N-acetyltransferase [Clostridia bacterium]